MTEEYLRPRDLMAESLDELNERYKKEKVNRMIRCGASCLDCTAEMRRIRGHSCRFEELPNENKVTKMKKSNEFCGWCGHRHHTNSCPERGKVIL